MRRERRRRFREKTAHLGKRRIQKTKTGLRREMEKHTDKEQQKTDREKCQRG